jgi:hypothetical protein
MSCAKVMSCANNGEVSILMSCVKVLMMVKCLYLCHVLKC